jgi:hypothetical protein
MNKLKKTLMREDEKNYQNSYKRNNNTFKFSKTQGHFKDINELIECVSIF